MNIPLKRSGAQLPPVFTHFSPSGRYVLTARVDERDMEELVFLEQVPADRARPRRHGIRVRLGDEAVSGAPELAIIDLAEHACRPVSVPGELLGSFLMTGTAAVTWDEESGRALLFAHSIGATTGQLLELDLNSGAWRVAVSETADPIYEPNTFLYGLPLVHVLPRVQEAIWFSQRDGWGHLYRHDLATGECLNQITSGELVVRAIVHVDAERREVLFLAGGDGAGNPYWRKLYRASLDGSGQHLLTPESCDHDIPAGVPAFFSLVFGQGRTPSTPLSPDGRFVVDHMSTVDQTPEIVLRNTTDGSIIRVLENTDVQALLASGYLPPRQFRVTADDGVTDLWGVLCIPPTATPEAPAPIVDLMYAGFQTTWQPSAFLGSNDILGNAIGPMAEFSELGIATFIVDGRGTPGRDKAFRMWTQGQGHTGRGLEDHVTAIRELAARHPEIDAQRIGVSGHSYGGYNSARAMFLFPDVFTVGVSSAGVHAPEKSPFGAWAWHVGVDADHRSASFRALSNLPFVHRLQGRLLLLFGELDENAPPDQSLALVDALVKAGKRFDMKLWPGVNHYQGSAYSTMCTWDHFVRHLLNSEPPATYVPATTRWDATGIG